MDLFPMFLKLAGRRCVVVGAGSIAESKITSLVAAEAQVIVIAPVISAVVRRLASKGNVLLIERCFLPADLSGAFLVIAATSRQTVNLEVFQEARACGVLCNVVDDPEYCDFYFPAVVRRGALQIAISTAGESPALSQCVRLQLEEQLDPTTGEWLARIGSLRREVLASLPAGEERKQLLHRLARREICELEECPTRKLISPSRAFENICPEVGP
jgi:precorrin-2 dehydrogenase / sirohydrochlorin ferrochelatase